MKILLRDLGTGLFYAGGDQWSNSAAEAFDFETPDVALDCVTEANLGKVELVMHFENSAFDVPVRIVTTQAR